VTGHVGNLQSIKVKPDVGDFYTSYLILISTCDFILPHTFLIDPYTNTSPVCTDTTPVTKWPPRLLLVSDLGFLIVDRTRKINTIRRLAGGLLRSIGVGGGMCHLLSVSSTPLSTVQGMSQHQAGFCGPRAQVFCLLFCKVRYSPPGLPPEHSHHAAIDLKHFDTKPELPTTGIFNKTQISMRR
jgi:hypothetical protein